MVYRFGEFELDEEQRALRLRGDEVPVQPLVFDLLQCLVRNRDRVVAKDELLDTLWRDTVVADGALQRAVSLARSALKQGGAEGAIRTYPRLGYRFRSDVLTDAQPSGEAKPSLTIDEARTAFARGDWPAVVELYRKADPKGGLTGYDLERWGQAAAWSGHPADALAPLERAVSAYSQQSLRIDAGRAAFYLAHIQFEARNGSLARGWHHRAKTLLSGRDETRELGLVTWLSARFALFEGDLDQAFELATNARALGQKLGDPDVEVLGLLYQGIVVLARGELRKGEALQDEAAASVSTSGITPWVGGTVFCGVLWGCLHSGDWKRATEWTQQFTRWCERTGTASYPGLCRLHRAEILSVQGELAVAEREVMEVCDVLAINLPLAEGDAYRVLGEIRLTKGDLDGAEDAFRQARELGWDPNPGFALLQAQQGRAREAVRDLRRSLKAKDWPSRQRHGLLLAHLVVIAAGAGLAEEARSALGELEELKELQDLPAQGALLARARGEVAFAEGRIDDAVIALREAVRLWLEIGSASNLGSTRCRLAQFLAAEGDRDAAETEFSAAGSIFRRIGATALAHACERSRGALKSRQ